MFADKLREVLQEVKRGVVEPATDHRGFAGALDRALTQVFL